MPRSPAELTRPPSDDALPPLQWLERISGRARHIRLELQDRDTALLVIPRGCAPAIAREFAAEKRAWIDRKRRELAHRTPAVQPLRWDGSDRIPLQGESRPLMLREAAFRDRGVTLGERIEVRAPAAWRDAPARLRKLLVGELREEARYRAEHYLGEAIERLGQRPSGLRIGDQKTVWGSCAADGTLSLNWRLVMAPPDVFRYVVVHELCHLVHRNHSPRYWSLVARQLPGYRAQVNWLREHGALLHANLARAA